VDSKGGIFCDLQKAFDCVNHVILLNTLELYGVTGKFKPLITSYLTKRYQKVILGNKREKGNSSNWRLITNEVPQGSVLGPLLFLFYINDLPNLMGKNTKMVLFADDTNILVTDSNRKNFPGNVKQTFQAVNTWFANNRLSLNINKTQFMEFKLSNYVNELLVPTAAGFDGCDLKQATETRFLGIILDGSLAWKQQIDQVVTKMSSACYVLRNIKYVVSQDILRMVYFANILY
jgi:hypothetical protein